MTIHHLPRATLLVLLVWQSAIHRSSSADLGDDRPGR